MALVLLSIAFLLLSSCSSEEPPKPALILWALDRPEKLTFIDPNQTEVAVLRGAISINESGVLAQPRRVSVEAPDKTKFISVVKIDAGRFDGYVPTTFDGERCVTSIREWTANANSTSLQIEFDAGMAQRPFYRNLLKALRPSFQRLTIAAPAAWCTTDPWVQDLPVDEVIPMLFRMGGTGGAVMDVLASSGDFPLDICKGHYGYSPDEKLAVSPPVIRIYAFNPRPWDANTYNEAARLLRHP